MEVFHWFHVIARWVLVLIEAAGLLWAAALLLVLLAWLVWGISHLSKRVRTNFSKKPPPRSNDASGDVSAQTARLQNHDPLIEMERTPEWRGTQH